MNNFLKLNPIKYIEGTIRLPGSKSISNRALLLSSLSKGTTYLKNLLNSDDIKYMLYALKKLKINFKLFNEKTECKIVGNINFLKCNKKIKLFLGNAGTVIRPLTAILSLKKNNVILTGEPRMKERPIGHLVDSLRQGGAKIFFQEKKDFPPVKIFGGFKGGNITIDGSLSSQYLTSILIAAPLASNNTNISIKGKLVSKPYIYTTLKLIKSFNGIIENYNYKKFYISANQKYNSPGEYLIEGDASSASYFFAAAAIKGGTVKVIGINKKSIQADIKFLNILEKMGAIVEYTKDSIKCTRNFLQGIDIDVNHIPDSAMTIAIVALFAKGKTTLRNIYNWRIKETDRLSAMAKELRKIGAIIEEGIDFIHIIPPKFFKESIIETYNDHRIAMCFSLIALSSKSVTILNPECTKKTFPNYFHILKKISKF